MSKYNLCANGHYYENTLQKCPYCPDAGQTDFNKTQIIQNIPNNISNNDDKTQLIEKQNINPNVKQDFNKTAIFSGNIEQNKQNITSNNSNTTGRKLVGWLVSFTIDALGVDFKLREGRNIIGSDAGCDIVVQDGQISGKHLTILYRMGEFKFKDELSTNGTFINEVFTEEGNLQDGDNIRIGNTIFKLRAAN